MTNKQRPRKIYFFEHEPTLKLFDFIQKLVFIIGIPLSILTYYQTSEKETKEREFARYNKLDEEYWQYEAMCTKIPLLGVSDATQADTTLAKYLKPDSLLSGEELIVRRQMMGLSISMYERAYLMYFKECTELQRQQWEGWAIPLKKWANNKIFIGAWNSIGDQFDMDFQQYVADSVLKNNIYLRPKHL